MKNLGSLGNLKDSQSMKAEAKVCMGQWGDKTLEEKEEARPWKAEKT